MENYVIVTTWNGEGYSEQSKAWIRQFPSPEKALTHIWEMFYQFDKETMNWTNAYEYSLSPDHKRVIFEDGKGNAGTWQCLKWTPDVFGVVIQTNINEVQLCSESEYQTRLREAIDETEDDEDIDYHTALAEKRVFIGSVGDYDLQFVRLNEDVPTSADVTQST